MFVSNNDLVTLVGAVLAIGIAYYVLIYSKNNKSPDNKRPPTSTDGVCSDEKNSMESAAKAAGCTFFEVKMLFPDSRYVLIIFLTIASYLIYLIIVGL